MGPGEEASRSFGVLGALEIRLGGHRVQILAGKARVVVAALLLHANQPVSIDTLIDYIWAEPPRSARTVLHSLVLRLRRAFGDYDVIHTHESGYVIRVAPGELDLDRFHELLAEADAARRVGEASVERAQLAAALELWRGPALAGVPSEALQMGEAERLRELQFATLRRRIDLDLAFGDHGELVGELRRLTRAHPLREGLWAQLMTALYGSGRQAEALTAYQDVRRTLAAELGIEPGGELRELHQAILTGDPALRSPSVPERTDTWRALCQLPQPAGDFTGRDADHDLLVERLIADEGTRLAVLWGAPGIGKTALAVGVAHRLRPAFPDGQWYVELQAHAPSTTVPIDPGELLAELLMASGIPPGVIPNNLAMRASLWRARLADRRVLLVLDDASGIDQVTPFLPGTATCAVLITSRSALTALPGAYHHRLNQLDSADAVEMLGRMIGEHRISAEPQPAERIAELCAGLPLALRILGARLTTQPTQRLAVLADRLEDERHRLDELSAAGLTVRAGLRISYEGLDQDTQRAFLHMGILPHGDFAAWTLGALADGTDGQRLVEQLTRAGLLEPATADATGGPRYRPHDLVALYARELATAADPELTGEATGRLLETLISLTASIRSRTSRCLEALPPEESSIAKTEVAIAEPNTWVHTERRLLLATIEQACGVGDHGQAAVLAALTIPVLAELGGFARLHETLTAIHQAAVAHGDELVAWRAEYGRATLALTMDLREATRAFIRCTHGFERLQAWPELAYGLAGLAFARSLQGIANEESAERAVRLARTAGRPALSALAFRSHADVLATCGRPEQARPRYEKALSHIRELGMPEAESDILVRYGRCLLVLGDLHHATAACDTATELITGRHDHNSLAWCLSLRSQILLHAGNHADALQAAQRAHLLMTRTGDTRGNATVSLDLAAAHLAAGQPAEAADLLNHAIPTLHRAGAGHAAAKAEQLLQYAGASGMAVIRQRP
jgi:DNA-binding SARP family transcriptional activator